MDTNVTDLWVQAKVVRVQEKTATPRFCTTSIRAITLLPKSVTNIKANYLLQTSRQSKDVPHSAGVHESDDACNHSFHKVSSSNFIKIIQKRLSVAHRGTAFQPRLPVCKRTWTRLTGAPVGSVKWPTAKTCFLYPENSFGWFIIFIQRIYESQDLPCPNWDQRPKNVRTSVFSL